MLQRDFPLQFRDAATDSDVASIHLMLCHARCLWLWVIFFLLRLGHLWTLHFLMKHGTVYRDKQPESLLILCVIGHCLQLRNTAGLLSLPSPERPGPHVFRIPRNSHSTLPGMRTVLYMLNSWLVGGSWCLGTPGFCQTAAKIITLCCLRLVFLFPNITWWQTNSSH